METIRNYKLVLPAAAGFLVLLSASIYSDKLLYLTLAVLGFIAAYYLMNNPVRLIYAQVFYNCIVKFLIENLKVPSYANYITDALTFLIVLAALRKIFTQGKRANLTLPLTVTAIFFLCTIIGLILNGQSISLYVWGFRNNFRFYGFFFGCAVFLKKKDVDLILQALMAISVVNVLLCTYQYFFMGMSMDNLGGIFGTNVGVNMYLNVFICITTVITLTGFMYKKTPLYALLFTVFANVYIAALGELKVFFIELAVIVFFVVLFSKPNKKTFFILAACMFGLYFGVQLFYSIFPYWKDFFSIQNIITSGQTYASPTDLGRFSAAGRVTDMFLTNPAKLLLGLGLGSAETSQIPGFTSVFYYEYGNLLHYTWLSQAFMLIENGWMGLACLMGFFAAAALSCYRIRKERPEFFEICVISQVIAVLGCLLVIYNSTLRTEAGYFVYFMLSLPFALNRNEDDKDQVKAVLSDG